MKEKIEWFQEVLALEPGSKVFFPLAKLYVETGQIDEAVATLRFGLGRQPDFMEARLLLIELLSRQGMGEDACREMEPLAGALKNYPAFWRNWAGSMAAEDTDLSSALSMTASHFEGRPLRWSQVIEEGLKSLTGILRGQAFAPADEPADVVETEVPETDFQDMEASEPEVQEELEVSVAASEPPKAAAKTPLDPRERIRQLSLRAPDQVPGTSPAEQGGIRTRTMANLLASQGDYRGALSIYEELGRTEDAMKMRALIEGESAASQPPAPAEEEGFAFDSTNKLIKTLERLAARLEARAEQQFSPGFDSRVRKGHEFSPEFWNADTARRSSPAASH